MFESADYSVRLRTNANPYSHCVFSHKAKLFRDYPEPWYSLQKNKVKNVTLAADKIDYTVVSPGHIFSFWRTVGSTSARKGYCKGMTLADGKLVKETGGGLCQLSNALYWAALHAGCDIVERHRHSFDVFPDSYRSVPFGAGATVFYNYVDLRFINSTSSPLLIRTWLDKEYLHVHFFSAQKPLITYKVMEENHQFTKMADDTVWRSNDLVRVELHNNVEKLRTHIAHNAGKVLYDIKK